MFVWEVEFRSSIQGGLCSRKFPQTADRMAFVRLERLQTKGGQRMGRQVVVGSRIADNGNHVCKKSFGRISFVEICGCNPEVGVETNVKSLLRLVDH